MIGTAGLRYGVAHGVPATLIGSISYMVPGVLLINGFVDLTSERLQAVGVQRLLQASFLFLILAVAVAVADALL